MNALQLNRLLLGAAMAFCLLAIVAEPLRCSLAATLTHSNGDPNGQALH